MSDPYLSCKSTREPKTFVSPDRYLIEGIGSYAFDNISPKTMGDEDEWTGKCLHRLVSSPYRVDDLWALPQSFSSSRTTQTLVSQKCLAGSRARLCTLTHNPMYEFLCPVNQREVDSSAS